MNRRMLMVVLAVVALGFVTGSTAEAGGGGGGSKKANRITVQNNQAVGNADMGVIWLPNDQDPRTWTQAKFLAKGGKPVSAGKSHTFPNVAPGAGKVWVFSSVGVPPLSDSEPYSVKGGSSLNYEITGDDGVFNVLGPTILQK